MILGLEVIGQRGSSLFWKLFECLHNSSERKTIQVNLYPLAHCGQTLGEEYGDRFLEESLILKNSKTPLYTS